MAVGCAVVEELNPVEGVQLYEFPTTEALPIVVEVVVQFKFLSTQASAVGVVVFTFTTTTSVAVHPLEPVTVKVYVVLTEGFAVG